MSLTSETNRVVATGDGSTTDFAFNKLLYDEDHLQVYIAGVLQTTGYTVTGVPGTSTSVTFTPAPTLDDQIILLRVVPITQLSVYAVGGAFPAATTEKNFDLAVMGLQQHDEVLNRAVTIPVTSTLAATDLPDPALAANYGKGLKIAGDGSGLDVFTINGGEVSSVLTTKGDVLIYSTTVDRLPIGADGTFLQANSATSNGLAWTGAVRDDILRVVGSGDTTKQVAFQVDGLTAAATRTLTVQDEDGTLALTSEFAYSTLAGSPGRMLLPPLHMNGFVYGNNAGDATNDLDIGAGACLSIDGTHNIVTAALTKRSDAAWVVGSAQGGLDTGAVGNSDYYIYAIKRADTGVCDVLFSLSASAPTMPANYSFKRLIGWFKRVGGAIVAFHTYEIEGGGLDFAWDSPTLDIDLAATLTTARRTDALKVPLNYSVRAHINARIVDAASAQQVYITCPDTTDVVPSATVAPLATCETVTTFAFTEDLWVRTSATGTIAARTTIATCDTYQACTLGFHWARRV